MIGQIIRSYLVSLGVQIDKPGFQQADATIRQTGDNIERVTGGMARNFVKASTIIASAMASVTASAVGLMKATANEDLAMQKYARSMMMSEQAAWNMKKATDALGESINDIALTPELMGRFNKLSQDGAKMMVGGDFKETMKNFRDLMFEFTRLKQEASYALNWVGYYLMKYLQKPLADIREKFKTFNDMVIKNMSVWTEKVARAIYYVIEVGRHLLMFIMDIGKHVKALWDSFPDGVKKAIAAITALQVALSAGPLGRAIMLISSLLLLIDDYYGYMEGKDALLGKYWDKLNNFLDTAKQKYEELKAAVEPYWEKFVGYLEQAQKWFDELMASIDEWSSSTGAEILNDFIDECKDWWQILNDLYDTIENGIKVTWQSFMESLEKNDTINDVRQLLERLWRIFVILYKAVKDVIDGIIRLVDEITKTEEWQEFIAVVGELFDGIVELFDAIMELVEVALTALFGEFHKTDTVLAFRDVLRAVLKIFTGIIRAVNWVIGLLKDLFKLVAGNTTFKKFWEEVGKEIGNAIEKIGKFGSKLRDLWDEITGKKSSGKGSKGGKESGQGDTDWNKRVVYEKFKAAGYSDEAIAGIMGRVQQEHNFNTSNVPEHWATDANGRKIWVGGYGMFQWNGGRTKRFLDWATSNGLNPQDPGVQADFAIIEAQERGITPERMNSKSVSESATIWTDEWEVGEHGYEQSYAAEIYDDIKNGAPWMNSTYNTPPQQVTPENVHEAATSNEEGKKIGYAGGASTGNANKELQLRFDDAKAAMRDRGYDFYIQNSTENSIGFTSPAEDWWNIRDVLQSYGLSVSHDEHGFYVSLDPNRSNPGYENYALNENNSPEGKTVTETIGDSVISAVKGVWNFNSKVGDLITGTSSNFVDTQTGNNIGSSLNNMNIGQLKEVYSVLMQYGGELKKMFGSEYINGLIDSLKEIMYAGSNNIFGNMRNFLPSGGNYNSYALGLAGGGGGSVVINSTVNIGDIYTQGDKVNGDVGKFVARQTVEAQADFFLNQSLAQPRIIPGPKTRV